MDDGRADMKVCFYADTALINQLMLAAESALQSCQASDAERLHLRSSMTQAEKQGVGASDGELNKLSVSTIQLPPSWIKEWQHLKIVSL